MRPNVEVIELWAAALESGEYNQTKGTLRRLTPTGGDDNEMLPVGYCCLGVLCELAVKAGVIPPAEPKIYTFGADKEWSVARYDDGHEAHLPARVQNWAGLSNPDPLVDYISSDVGREALSFLNDTGTAFPDIAAAIRKTWLAQPDTSVPA